MCYVDHKKCSLSGSLKSIAMRRNSIHFFVTKALHPIAAYFVNLISVPTHDVNFCYGILHMGIYRIRCRIIFFLSKHRLLIQSWASSKQWHPQLWLTNHLSFSCHRSLHAHIERNQLVWALLLCVCGGGGYRIVVWTICGQLSRYNRWWYTLVYLLIDQ